MKRISSIIISLIILLNTALGYTSTVVIKGVGLVVSTEEGSEVEIESKTDISGWEVKTGNTTVTDNKFTMPAEDVEIEGIISKYLLTLEFPTFTKEESKNAGESITVEAITENLEYSFLSWTAIGITLTEEQQTSTTITFTMPENAVTLIANYSGVENKEYNSPVLGAGLTPVNWNGSTWVDTTEENWDYNYEIATAGHGTVEGDGTGKWANARTADGSMYVWIPRYSYKITSGEHSEGNSWSSVDNPGTNKIEVKFSNGTVDNTGDGYIAHPAFTFGTDELEGIWVAKYEASRNDATESSEGTGTVVSSKPGVVSWRNTTVSDMYSYTYNLNRNLDSHLMKNSEWGAVAYLTNAIGKIPYINNSSDYITGNAGGSQDASEATGVTNAWNTVNGVKASSTHNVYGIYDLSGGAWEYVSAYVDNGNDYLSIYASSLVTNKETKYVDVYPIGTTDSQEDNYAAWSDIKGNAMYETTGGYNSYAGDIVWDRDYTYVTYGDRPIFSRGGGYDFTNTAGLFSFGADVGCGENLGGFRAVLAIPSGGNGSSNEPMLASGSTWYSKGGTSVAKTSITSIEIRDSEAPTTYVESWDASDASVPNTVTAYLVDDGSGNSTYKLYLVGDGSGVIYANPDSSYAFSDSDPSIGFTSITAISGMNILNTSNVTDMYSMFDCCSQLSSLDVSSFNTNNVTNMAGMFASLNQLSSLDVSSFNTSNVTDMSYMFFGCTELVNLDLSNFNTSNVINMSHMFQNCYKLSSLNLNGFVTNNVTDMSCMFCGCNVLSSLDVSSFNTSNVTDMRLMFNDCNALSSLDVSSFNTSNVTNMASMFYQCSELINLDLSNFNTSNVTLMNNMFHNCYKLSSLDVSSFNTNNVTNMAAMFCGCGELSSLDLIGFNTSKVTDMYNMFWDTNKLQEIKLGANFSFTGDGSTSCTLSTPSSTYITGADGNWYNTARTAFTPSTVPSNVADTYYASSALIANSPKLGTGMTPVNWNGSTWVDTTEENWDYNYEIATAGHGTVAGDGTGKWANARTADGSMYVWIPRYSYKITSGEHSSGNSWSSVDNPGTNKIEVKFSNGTTDDTSDSYIAHPAFTFGTDELEGIWVAKYEASRNDATSSSEGTGTTVSSKPGVVSWRNLSVSNMYDYAYNLNRDLDSHLMKNSEWGAVAYLTNAIGKIPYINNSSSYITGNAGGSQDASEAEGVTNAWNTAGGVKASTTHNVYGIYDLSGGAFEYVSAYYTGGDSTYLSSDTSNKAYAGSLYTNKDTKYVETYTAYASTKKGDAVYETSSSGSNYTSWDGDTSFAPDSSRPVFARGGIYRGTSDAGVFYFYSFYGHGSPSGGFRAVLTMK